MSEFTIYYLNHSHLKVDFEKLNDPTLTNKDLIKVTTHFINLVNKK
jgi:hypothetical protein